MQYISLSEISANSDLLAPDCHHIDSHHIYLYHVSTFSMIFRRSNTWYIVISLLSSCLVLILTSSKKVSDVHFHCIFMIVVLIFDKILITRWTWVSSIWFDFFNMHVQYRTFEILILWGTFPVSGAKRLYQLCTSTLQWAVQFLKPCDLQVIVYVFMVKCKWYWPKVLHYLVESICFFLYQSISVRLVYNFVVIE